MAANGTIAGVDEANGVQHTGRTGRGERGRALRGLARPDRKEWGLQEAPSMTRDTVTLEDLRQRLNDLDRQIIQLVAERKALSEEVARAKRATGKPTRDYEREREVIMSARAMATERGVSPELAEQLLRLLIRSSLTTQEQASVVAHGAGSGRRALVIGGAGKMGGWFVNFLHSQGFEVEVADPAAAAAGVARVEIGRASCRERVEIS